MILAYVTLTGADESVKPEELYALSWKYDFVEWGILFSQSKTGQARYPTLRWLDELLDRETERPPWGSFAAHLCGKWVDDVLNGELTIFRDERFEKFFDRIQLNLGRRLRLALKSQNLLRAVQDISQSVMLGGDYSHIFTETEALWKHRLYPLFDASGGRGISTKVWPKPFEKAPDDFLYGYAGGLGPDNIEEELSRIAEAVGDREVWVDMETKLRTGEKFDLEKCKTVLEACKPWVK